MALTICAKCKREWQANSGVELCPWCRASRAESSLASMRQRKDALEEHAYLLQEKHDAALTRAERAEACLRRIQRLADDGVDDPAGPHNVLAQIANTVEAALSSPPADASKMGNSLEQRLIEALTPSAETKSAYMGEFLFRAHESNDVGEEFTRSFTVPWTTIKEIMKAIRERAALADMEQKS